MYRLIDVRSVVLEMHERTYDHDAKNSAKETTMFPEALGLLCTESLRCTYNTLRFNSCVCS